MAAAPTLIQALTYVKAAITTIMTGDPAQIGLRVAPAIAILDNQLVLLLPALATAEESRWPPAGDCRPRWTHHEAAGDPDDPGKLMSIRLRFFVGTGLASRAIQWFSAGNFSHVAAIWSPAQLLDSRSDVVASVPAGVRVRLAESESVPVMVDMELPANADQVGKWRDFWPPSSVSPTTSPVSWDSPSTGTGGSRIAGFAPSSRLRRLRLPASARTCTRRRTRSLLQHWLRS